MRAISAFGLVVLMGVAVRPVAAEDDHAKKIVGTWVVTKGEEFPAGTIVEFTKDGKMSFAAKKKDGKLLEVMGTYKIEKDKLIAKISVDGKEVEETDDIVKLTDDALELRDKDKKVVILQKKK